MACLLIAACALAVGQAGCGSSARIEAGDLKGATFSEVGSDGAAGEGFELDLASGDTLRTRLLSAYRTMGAWKGDPEKLPAPDLFLTLTFTDDRETVLACARDNQSFIIVEQYEHGRLVDVFIMRPKLMYEFMNDLVEQARMRR